MTGSVIRRVPAGPEGEKKSPGSLFGGEGNKPGQTRSRPGKPGTYPAQGGRAGSLARSGRNDRFR